MRQPVDEPDLAEPRVLLLSEAFGYDLDTIEWITLNSAKSAFLPHDQRLALINEVIKPGYARLRTAS